MEKMRVKFIIENDGEELIFEKNKNMVILPLGSKYYPIPGPGYIKGIVKDYEYSDMAILNQEDFVTMVVEVAEKPILTVSEDIKTIMTQFGWKYTK